MYRKAVVVFVLCCTVLMAAGKTTVANITKSDAKTITQKINYQGYLTDNSSNPITNPSLSIDFAIYDDEFTGSLL